MKNVAWSKDRTVSFIRKNFVWIILGVVGVLLLCLSSVSSNKGQNESQKENYCQAYVDNMEEKLGEIVCEIAGVKNCNVMITLKSGIEYVYATDESANTDVNETGGDKKEQSEEKITIVADKQIGEKAVVVKERYPEISGVAIICNAADSPALTLALKSAASTALGIDTGKVCVVLRG